MATKSKPDIQTGDTGPDTGTQTGDAGTGQQGAPDAPTATPGGGTPQDTGTGPDGAPDADGATPTAPATGTAAAPLTPDEATEQRSPHLGVQDSSTNPVAANAAIQSPPGAVHIRLVDDDDHDVALDDLFAFPGADNPSTFATVPRRVYEQFTYPGTTVPSTHLLYAQGAQVPVTDALRVVETFKHQAPQSPAAP